jgi:predicted RNA-binding Zn ribbon-like protein
MARTQTKGAAVWKDGFLIVGNHLALDFLNTQPVRDGEAMELLPDFAALLRWFQTAGLLRPRDVAVLEQQWGQSAAARRTVEAIRRFREKLRKEVLEWEQGHVVRRSAIDEVNRLMTAYPMSTRLKTNGKALSAELYFKPQHPEDLFAPLAHAAAMLLANADRGRVRKCDQCVLHFVDTSKKGTRRWCSMQLCGNRLKVAAHAARRRSASVERSSAER